MAHHHLAIDYIELDATDLAATKRFYGQAFGWTFRDYGDAYVGFSDGSAAKEAGGFRKGTPTAGGALVLLYSNGLEKTRDAIVAAGGKIVKEITSFPGGRRFSFADLSGNVLGVWTED